MNLLNKNGQVQVETETEKQLKVAERVWKVPRRRGSIADLLSLNDDICQKGKQYI